VALAVVDREADGLSEGRHGLERKTKREKGKIKTQYASHWP